MNSDFFFFSSRRRHTRLVSDWSSDVCSSDLFAQQGYAVVNYSARGFGQSCGKPESRTLDCQQQAANGLDPSATGWVHLKDRRREAHDTQFLLGKLVDQGFADPNALGATGI